jgi:hypothetical protein
MPQVHIVSKTYQDPRSEVPTINRVRVYGGTFEKAVAIVQGTAAPFEHVELAWSEETTDELCRLVNSL